MHQSRFARPNAAKEPFTRYLLVSVGLHSLGLAFVFFTAEFSDAMLRQQRPATIHIARAEQVEEVFEEFEEPTWELEEPPELEELLDEIEPEEWAPLPTTEEWDFVPEPDVEPPLEEFVADLAWDSSLWSMRFPVRNVESDPAPEPQELEEPLEQEEEPGQDAVDDEAPGDSEPILLEAPPPPYPRVARRFRWEGTVLCRISVGIDGGVTDVTVEETSGHTALDEAAVKAVRAWRFQPGLRMGAAAAVEVLHRVTFRLDA